MGRGFKGEYNHTVYAKGRLIVPAKFRELPLTTKDARKFSRFFFAGAADCEVDKQGRILIPSVLREFAGIGKEAVLVGVLNRVEIWSKERWLGENEYEDMDEVAEHMAELGLGI